MRFVSLFAGIGGIDLGLENAGWECVAQVENDEWCSRILEKHWPEVPRYGDVSDVSGGALPATDAIVGGFPCQPVSLVGRREGQGDPRWLWPHFARLVDEVRPRIVVVENVPGLRSLGGAEVVTDLAAMGYDHQWGELSAAAVGAPHLRQRFVLVAYPHDERLEGHPGHGARGGGRPEAAGYSPTPGLRRGAEEELADPDSETRGPEGTAGQEVPGPEEIERSGRRSGSEWDPWAVEPDVGRVAHGVPNRLDRLRGLGNAVVPQVALAVGEWINAHLPH